MDEKLQNNHNKKQKIVLMHFSGPPMISGVDILIKDQARLFRHFGYKVDIIAGIARQFRKDIPVHIIRRINPKHPLVFRVRQELEKGIVSPVFKKLETSLYKSVKKYLWENHIGIVILHNVMTRHYNLALTSALAELIQDLPQIKFYAWVHNISCFDDPYFGLNPKLKKIHPWKVLLTRQSNLTYLCISNYLKKNLLGSFGQDGIKKIYIIPNLHDIPKFLGLTPAMRAFYDLIDGRQSDLIACLPVRAVPRKNLELAVEIAREIVARGIKFKLILTANIDYKRVENLQYYNKIKNMVATYKLTGNIFFLEEYFQKYFTTVQPKKPKPGIPIPEVYLISDFLLMTSVIEEFGLPILEAGLMRCPIFASDIPVFREIGTTNINYFSLSERPGKIAEFILAKMKSMPQAYFYRKVINKYSLHGMFRDAIIPLIEGKSLAR